MRYSEVLKPGQTRKDVHDYLSAHKTEFRDICCYRERTAFATVVEIGDMGAPWFCSEWPLNVVFEFTPVPERQHLFHPSDMDVLKYVHLASNGAGCP